MTDTVPDQIREIHQKMITAADHAGRNPDAITLVAVSKKQPDDRIDSALKAGQRIYGENRVQEAMERWGDRRRLYPDLELRLIGPLQTNKAGDAVALFDVIESVDREKLARILAEECRKQDRRIECLIQVNTGEEDQKAGIAPGEAVGFSHYCRDDLGLNVTGLMCIPPMDEEAAMHFTLLNTLAREAGLDKLSMGMSADYEQAIGFGATHVRVGSALFGDRPQPA